VHVARCYLTDYKDKGENYKGYELESERKTSKRKTKINMEIT
jgi:hypothetical protein